ncbi:MAG TPA: hypothetical protein VFI46_04065, partial [Jiangellaceae bacterium]|nr:hypothetical protein [Jiangellaceae bacterium]
VQGLAAAVHGIEATRTGSIGVRSLQSWAEIIREPTGTATPSRVDHGEVAGQAARDATTPP